MKSLLAKLSVVLGLFLLVLPLTFTYAAAGCCSHHGGVKGCNTATNHDMCKDGTTSPTCLCSGGTTTKAVKTKTTKSTVVNTTTTATTPATTETTAPATATTETTVTKTKSTKGCCARHGGVAKCDTASGYQMCKDGTTSATCKC